MLRLLFSTLLLLLTSLAIAQTATMEGTIIDGVSREPIKGATVIIDKENVNAISDNDGRWTLEIKPGLYNISVSHVSYKNNIIFEHRVHIAQTNVLDIELVPEGKAMSEVTISADAVSRSAENGNNIKSLEIDEIQRMPGAVQDISKVIKNFPGVSPRVSFGYNIIVRGGGSFENKYYLDGIEIPAITHFSVQGLSGGPNGLINTDLIKRVTFKSGSFPANRGNSLSSVMELEQKAGRRDRFGGKLTLGAAEYGAHIEGPLSKYSSYIFSFRKSYTEYLLKAFDLPVLPAFSDFQYKHKFWLPNNDELTIIGLGAYDKYRLNFDTELTDAILYNTGFIPEGDQNTTVFGANYKHFTDKGTYNFIASHTRFTNFANKFYDNSFEPGDESLIYNSTESETKFQVENKFYYNNASFNYGISYDFVQFDLDQYSIFASEGGVDTLNIASAIDYQKYGFFASYNRSLSDKWNLFLGARIDGNSFGSRMSNPFQQISPRASIQYIFNSKVSATLQTGIYYQAPPNVLLGYKEEGELINQENLEYIESTQASLGMDYKISANKRINVDFFYKAYDQYPFLLRDSISFANASGEYVTVGNQAANSDSKGRAYGAEFFYQQKLQNDWFSNVSASYVVSEFEDKKGNLVSSAWDNRFFLNMTLGRQLKKNWTLGAKFTYAGANPYTPYNEDVSSNIETWQANRRGIYDFNRLNSEKLPAFHSLDFRVDKKWYKKNATIIAFLDIQNLYSNSFQLIPYLTLQRDEDGEPLIDPTDPTKYALQTINSDTGRVLPTIGFSIEF